MVTPPKAPIQKHSNFYHGQEYIDNYHWIRNITDPRVLDYIKEENDYADQKISEFQDLHNEIYQEIKSRTKETDQSVPEKVDNYYYYERTEKDREYEIYCRKKESLDNPEEIYLNLNLRSEEFIDLGDFDISPDHKFLAYTLDFTGNENYTLFIKNLQTNLEQKFIIERLGGSVCWAKNNSGLFYDVLNEVNIPARVYYAPDVVNSSEKYLLFEEPDLTKEVYFYKTKDKKYFMVSSDTKDSSEIYFLNQNDVNITSKSLKLFKNRKEGVIYQIYHNHDYFYILTNDQGCENFKILRIKEEHYESNNWEVFLDYDTKIVISHMEMFEKYIVVHLRKKGLREIAIYNILSNYWYEIDQPDLLHTINYHETPNNDDYHTEILRFSYSSLVTPNTIIDYNMLQKTSEIMKIDEISNYNKNDFICERLYAYAKDGERIPISVFYKKELSKNGNNPLLLYSYGSYGTSTEPGFSSSIISLVERGVVYALAHVRGGGEFGRNYYLQGKYQNKINTFTDFIACLEYLIKIGFTNQTKIAIRGSSAGGLLIGTVINMAPELIHTAVMSVPFVDVVNTMMDATIPLTTLEFFEFGNPIESKAIFDYMRSYSPYDNLKNGKYPNMLVLTNINDTRVAYWEPVKYTAKLRSLNDNLLILKTNLKAGHGGSSGKYEYLKELSLEYAFILHTIT
jgi:oligopeptidase B